MDKSKLKPFNLERALAGDPVVTTLGIRVIQLSYFPKSNYETGELAVLLEREDRVRSYKPNGDYSGLGNLTNYTLFMAPKTREVWVNLYTGGAFVHGEFYGYVSEEEANRCDMNPGARLGGCAHKITIPE